MTDTTIDYLSAVGDELAKMGVLIDVIQVGDGDRALYAGPRADWPDAYGYRHRAVELGGNFQIPGSFDETWPLAYGPSDSPVGFEVADGTPPATVAAAMAALIPEVEARRERFERAVEAAVEGMWMAASRAYPEVETGDFGPGETMAIEQAIRSALGLWLNYNRPDEGIAPTTEAAGQILAARRAAAVQRLAPIAADMDGDQFWDLVEVTCTDHHEAFAAGHDFEPLGEGYVTDGLKEYAYYRAGEARNEGLEAGVDLMIELVGERQAKKELVAAHGDRCTAVQDGDVCGSELDCDRHNTAQEG